MGLVDAQRFVYQITLEAPSILLPCECLVICEHDYYISYPLLQKFLEACGSYHRTNV